MYLEIVMATALSQKIILLRVLVAKLFVLLCLLAKLKLLFFVQVVLCFLYGWFCTKTYIKRNPILCFNELVNEK